MISFLSSSRSRIAAFRLVLLVCAFSSANSVAASGADSAAVSGAPITQTSAKHGAQESRRSEKVELSQDRASLVLNGTIKGYETVDYLVDARAGQILTISFQSSNLASYFNVIEPGTDFAMFNGAMLGNSYTNKLSANGSYTIRIYMMRNAARRNETASYTLNLSLFE